jgi:hypothetical protein
MCSCAMMSMSKIHGRTPLACKFYLNFTCQQKTIEPAQPRLTGDSPERRMDESGAHSGPAPRGLANR